MHRYCALLSLACAIGCSEGVVLRNRAALHAVSLETSDDSAAYSEAESEDRLVTSFLQSQLDATESELVKLQQLTAPVEKKAAAAVTPAIKAPEAKKEKSSVAATVAKKVVAAPAVKKTAAKSETDILKTLKLPSSLLKGKAALAPMLAMLKGLYEDSKDRISQQNVREEKSKKWFTSKEAEHKAKLDKVEATFKNGTLSEEFRTNETRDENRYFNYWQRVRERQHRQFHTNLKIQHAMMTKTKKMIDMYEKTLSSKPADQAAAKKQLSGATGMPEIVFLQNFHRTVGEFCKDSLAQVRKERAELQQWSAEGVAW